MKISIVINNYNYAQYVGACIESAIRQAHKNVEIVVVDDGSTDDSVSIIEKYTNSIRLIRQPNSGQGGAYNSGYAASTGDVICFLDADDILLPEACEMVAKLNWTGVSKVQGRLAVINGAGERTGLLLPLNSSSDLEIANAAMKFYFYNSPPSSGNFYHRDFLRLVMPMPQERWRLAADAYVICRAPFHGRVAVLDQVLGLYRVHEKNHSTAGGGEGTREDLLRFARREYLKEQLRRSSVHLYYRQIFHRRTTLHDSPSLIKLRILMYKASGTKRFRSKFWPEILDRTLYVVFYWPPYSPLKRLMLFVWVVMAAILPERIFRRFAWRTVFAYRRGY